MKAQTKKTVKKIIEFVLNPRLILCIGTAWMITNGWAYIIFGLGLKLNIQWMKAVGGGYLAIVWLPMTPEKILTVLISIGLLRWWFPKDKKTLAALYHLLERTKDLVRRRRDWFRNLKNCFSRKNKNKDD